MASCPFCDAALPRDLACRAVPGTTRRLSRLAAFTFATTTALAAAAAASCGGHTEAEGDAGRDGGDGGDGFAPGPHYGAPPLDADPGDVTDERDAAAADVVEPPPCKPLDAACSTNASCCSGVCDPSTETCAASIALYGAPPPGDG